MRLYSFLILLCLNWHCYAQLDSIQQLDAVYLTDELLLEFSEATKTTVLPDSLLKTSPSSLTHSLRQFKGLYFREYGNGMVASLAFRGTNAAHTQVVWNGIPINSPLTGQTDFNTLHTNGINQIQVRYGGGSVQYGSGALGGSIHLQQKLRFKTHNTHFAQLGIASFSQQRIQYQGSIGTASSTLQFGVSGLQSKNNYPYLGTALRNENGQFTQAQLNVAGGFLNTKGQIFRVYHQSFMSSRNLSGTLVSLGRDKYEDITSRTLASFSTRHKRASIDVSAAHLFETFKYFENHEKDIFTSAQAHTMLLQGVYKVALNTHTLWRTQLLGQYIIGQGDAFTAQDQGQMAISSLFKSRFLKSGKYTVQIRKDFNTAFKAPFVYALATTYKITKNTVVNAQHATHFRSPTFNDLYWQPGGNPTLLPEKATQFEVGVSYQKSLTSISLQAFTMQVSNLIRWLPNTQGLWTPENIDHTLHKGLEFEAHTALKLKRLQLNLNTGFTYTSAKHAIDNTPLFYVPNYQALASLQVRRDSWQFIYRHTYTSQVEAIGRQLDDYHLGMVEAGFHPKFLKQHGLSLTLRVQNIWNNAYEIIALRPMPPRNYELLLTFNI